jgi:hypothetical protein
MVVVLSEDSFVDRNTINGRELHATVDAARMFGCRIYQIPPNFDVCETAENALAYLPIFDPPVIGIWAGYIPSVDRYRSIYEAALAKGVRLVNSPAEHQTAMEFDKFYPLLGELTPESVILTTTEGLAEAGTALGFPVFVKGAVKSNKDKGLSACIATNSVELAAIATDLLTRERRSRGRIVIRRLVKFRTIATDSQSFPLGREYRVFVSRDGVLAHGFYWDEYHDSQSLSAAEERQITVLSIEAARRVGTPFIAVDVGQLESGKWIAIEVSDGQFAGLGHVGVLELWSKLKDLSV